MLASALPTWLEVSRSGLGPDDIDRYLRQVSQALSTAIAQAVSETNICQWSVPGFSSDLKERISKVKRLRERYQSTRDAVDFALYKMVRNAKNRLLKKSTMLRHRSKVEEAATHSNGI